MLGVKIGDYLEITQSEGTFLIMNDGLYHLQTGTMCPEVLSNVLTGKVCIKRPPWKPTYDQGYYIVLTDGTVVNEEWFNDSSDMNYYKLGNCYRTAAEAEAHRTEWVKFYASDEILEV
jgi:hypothetical protein